MSEGKLNIAPVKIFSRKGLSVFLFLLFFLVSFFNTNAQTPEKNFFVVDSIQIFGNETTKDYIILRELTFTKGDTVNEKILRFNRERVYSLGIFNQVEILPLRRKEKTTILILVKESWYIYPLPLLSIEGSHWERISYGLDFLWKNFRGRNETLHLIASFGYDPIYSIRYYAPVFAGLKNTSFDLLLAYQKVSNKSSRVAAFTRKDFSYTSILALIGFGERLNQFNEVKLFSGFQYVEQPFESLNRFAAGNSRVDRMPVLEAVYTLDTRDLKQFSSKGSYLKFDYFQKGFGINNVSYNVVNLDLRRYQPLWKDFTFKTRLMARHAWGKKIPYYDYSYFGYREIIRGHSFDYSEGESALKLSFDLNYSLLDEWNFSIKLPLIPEKLTSARIGIRLGLFYDTGSTFDNNERINPLNFSYGYGAGIILLLLPYNSVRMEYALNEFGKGEFLVGLGFAY